MASELDDLEVSSDEKAILDERWTAFLKNPASAQTLEQFKDKLKALRCLSRIIPPCALRNL